MRRKPGLEGYYESVEKIMNYLVENPPWLGVFKIENELYADTHLVIPDKLRSGRINLFCMIHEWYFEGSGKRCE